MAAAGPQFFGLKDYLNLPNLKDLKSIFEGPQYTKWQSFRESEDARYVGLAMPRFLARLPYGAKTSPVEEFNFEEETAGGEHGARPAPGAHRSAAPLSVTARCARVPTSRPGASQRPP